MRYFLVQVSNIKATGGIDSDSTKKVLVTDKHDSIDFIRATKIVGDELLKKLPEGLNRMSPAGDLIP